MSRTKSFMCEKMQKLLILVWRFPFLAEDLQLFKNSFKLRRCDRNFTKKNCDSIKEKFKETVVISSRQGKTLL